ncbi:MAG: hypothetical protein EU529_13540 [Promethearchaeota archaeon]|nr:MAG: hypothetical protein EU529_13540 [Candidatus Lokiarchaeota archaeon]
MVYKEKYYKKALIVFGLLFIFLSSIELFNIFLLLATQINLYGKKMLFQEFIFNSTYVSLSGTLIFIFLISSICFFFIIGLLLLKLSSRKIDNKSRAKSMLMFGILILIFSFMKLGYITLLGRTEITIGGKLKTFQHIIFSANLAPFYVVVIWLFFTGVVCYYLMVGLVFGALGLHWILELEKEEAVD